MTPIFAGFQSIKEYHNLRGPHNEDCDILGSVLLMETAIPKPPKGMNHYAHAAYPPNQSSEKCHARSMWRVMDALRAAEKHPRFPRMTTGNIANPLRMGATDPGMHNFKIIQGCIGFRGVIPQ